MRVQALVPLLKSSFRDWQEDKASRLAAALAYYTIFAIAPLLVIAIGIAGMAFGREAAQGQVVREMQGLLGEEGARMIQETIQSAGREDRGLLATAIGVIVLLFGASGVFGQLKDGLNTIWEVAPKPGRGLLGIVKDRFASFTMVLGIGFLLLVSLGVSAWLGKLGELAGEHVPGPPILAAALHFAVSFGVITVLFAMIYKILPDVEIRWGDVWLGAAATALLFTAGKFLLGFYLGKGSAGSAFGAAGGLVILLVWVYWSAQILFFGAEFTQVYANEYGSRIVPDEDAVGVTAETRAQEGMPDRDRLEARARGNGREDGRRRSAAEGRSDRAAAGRRDHPGRRTWAHGEVRGRGADAGRRY
ncbi:MAG: YihY/virulence factor BrkB family protein, partial [Gemmatimonadetes bacterium]|nr:YihY/virulence factor BrkB family protein [Gemmatimonadota bacterium]